MLRAGKLLPAFGGILNAVGVIYGIVVGLSLAHSELGIVGVLLGVLFLPLTTVVSPGYILVAHGDCIPTIIVYGGLLAGTALIILGVHISEKYDD